MRLDGVDRQIMSLLRNDARTSYSTIGASVGLSAPAVKRRVDRMLDAGVIRGFHADVDPEAAGWQVEAIVDLFCQGRTSRDDIADLVARMPEVTSAFTVTGEANAILHLRVEDIEHLQRALEAIRGEGVVQQTRSHIVLTRLTSG
ncbi:Lrp/AsnC family transcriptional regulator [Angustibacter aerolatus]|uniref:AsnC family transcriptional regulator n=1 Tax=Angustibacter aerolatus TaxID=1162965 RepID=A0ABQ6JI92_9ACTN|nr:AsnC family transcriptional regulator [Angustibacter aerolatus]